VKNAASLEQMAVEQDQRISEVVKREQSRLRSFIRRRVPDPRDAEDILQDVFYALVEANRLPMPITVELAVAAALQLATDYFLAGARTSGAVPDPLRRIWAPRWLSLQFPPPDGRALGPHDP
jgi:hypothetical protein